MKNVRPPETKLVHSGQELSCTYGHICSGCSLINEPYRRQIGAKREKLLANWSANGLSLSDLPEIETKFIDIGGLSDRVDLMIDQRQDNYRVGLFDRNHKSIVDIQSCPQMSPTLEQWYEDFRTHKVDVTRGSVRLRVSPSGQRGIWLDLANIDIKYLLDDRVTLDALAQMAFVELGQRRKKLVEKEGLLKLGDPELQPWSETYIGDDSCPAPLYCTVGSFTQPGFKANRVLVDTLMRMIQNTQARHFIEFGAGIGNFTLPLADRAEKVVACEIDELACEGLDRSLREQGLRERVEILRGNFQRDKARQMPKFSGFDAILVDPPRSGLKHFLDPLEALSLAERPAHFFYVSCFAESFTEDAARLASMGYRARQLTIVDQFPQSLHFEITCEFAL